MCVALMSWATFFLTDFIMFLILAGTQRTAFQDWHVTVFPDIYFLMLSLAAYLVMGAATGIGSYPLGWIQKKIFSQKTDSTKHRFAIPLSFAVATVWGLNIYSNWVYRLHFSHLTKLLLCFGLIVILYAIVFNISKRLQKHPAIIVISMCAGAAVFWSSRNLWSYFEAVMSSQTIILLLSCLCAIIFFVIPYFLCSYIAMKKKSVYVLFFAALVIIIIRTSHLEPAFSLENSISEIESEGKKPNIVLIVMDTVRVDHVSCYGYKKETTPNIDLLSRESVKYTSAYSTASWTLPSVASMFTGLYPGKHGAHRVKEAVDVFFTNKLAAEHETLPEMLRQYGYTTAGVVSCMFLTESFGMDRGFDYFDSTIYQLSPLLSSFTALNSLNRFAPITDYLNLKGFFGFKIATQVNRSAIPWLKSYDGDNPFFLFLHYFDPHHPYLHNFFEIFKVPKEVRKKYGFHNNYVNLENTIIDSVIRKNQTLDDTVRGYLIKNYDKKINHVDEKIGDIIATLKKLGLYDNSIIIITSDHGESFGENNLMIHGYWLYENNIHVPLIIKYPEQDNKIGIVNYPVSLTGLAPTVLSYLSLPIPEQFQGVEFSNEKDQKIIAQNFVSPNLADYDWSKRFDCDIMSLRYGNHKYIKCIDGNDQLFDIINDHDETRNIIDTENEIKIKLEAILSNYIEQLDLAYKLSLKTPDLLHKTTLETLRALGYIE